MNDIDLSKTMSYALRHNPEQFGLILDKFGWVNVNKLTEAIISNSPKYRNIKVDDINRIVKNDIKGRYEIINNNIRALYGHSIAEKIEKIPVNPPNILYHGTNMNAWKDIEKNGLKSMNRQYVHLSKDTDTAVIVAKRRTKNPIILVVNAEQAFKDGINFYSEPNDIWLADAIPSKYISF